MTDRFKRALKASTVGHVSVVLVAIFLPVILHWIKPPKPKEMITFVDLVAPMPAWQPPAPEKEPELPQKPPEPKKPDLPEPKKEEITKPAEKPKIKISTNLVRRASTPAPASAPKKSNLTPDQIKKLLAAGIPQGPGPAGAPGETSELGWYYALVRTTMYEAWDQPSGLSGAAGLVTRVLIRVQRDGTITDRRMEKGSGSSVMDTSVMKAVNSVSRLRSPPPQLSGEITIDFELTGTTP